MTAGVWQAAWENLMPLNHYAGVVAIKMEPTSGLEPLTCRLRIGCSTN
jgi:hypothetical protein